MTLKKNPVLLKHVNEMKAHKIICLDVYLFFKLKRKNCHTEDLPDLCFDNNQNKNLYYK